MADNSEELFPVVDPEGNTIGKISRGEAHNGSRILHPVVHLHVFDPHGRLYLQRRPTWKDIQPDKWDTACGGHVDYGETPEQALRREVREELGMTEYTPRLLDRYVFDSKTERELVWVYSTVYDHEPQPNEQELAGGRFWSKEEIMENIGKGVFTPNFESEYLRLFG